MDHARWMNAAIDAARKGVLAGQSPFGAAIVRGDELVVATHNVVWKTTDPTAHAEVNCIRQAAAALKAIDLSGCRMYTTTEPCPMCAAAIHWSKLDEVWFGASIADADKAGFSELRLPIEEIYARGSPVRVHRGLMARECAELFQLWKQNAGRAY